MNNIRCDLDALQNSTDCLKKAAYKTDLEVINIDNVKYIKLRKYCRFFLLGRLISYIRYWLCSTDNINKQIREVAETHKTYATAAVHSLFNANVPENKFLDIQRYVGIVDGLLSQSGFVEPISFEKTFVERCHRLFPEKMIAQLAEAAAADQQSPEQIALIAKSQRLIQITNLFKINCVEVNQVKTALSTPKVNPALQGKNPLSDRQAALFKDDVIEEETESVEDSSKEEEIEIEGDDIFSEDGLLTMDNDSTDEEVNDDALEGPLEEVVKNEKQNLIVEVDKAKEEVDRIAAEKASAEKEEAEKMAAEKAEDVIRQLLNHEIKDKEGIQQLQAEIEEIRKRLENTKSALSFSFIFQEWIDAHVVQADINEIKNAFSTGQFSKELNAKIKKLDTYSLMKQLDKDYTYPPFEEIATVRVAYRQLKEILNGYQNFNPSKYINYINRLLKRFSELESCPDLQTSISQDFLAIVEQIEQKIEKSAWESLPAIKKQHDKFVEFATFYKGLQNLENISFEEGEQKRSTCPIKINIGITTDRNYGDVLKEIAYRHYNKSFRYWKAGDHNQLKCTFQFAENVEDNIQGNTIYDLLMTPVYCGGGRMETRVLNKDIARYLDKNKLEHDGFIVIILIIPDSASQRNYSEYFKGKEHYPAEFEEKVKNRTIFISRTTNEKDPQWKNDTAFKEKIKQILIKKACMEKAKSLLK